MIRWNAILILFVLSFFLFFFLSSSFFRGGQLESLQSRDESSFKKKNQQQKATKSDGKSNYNNLPRRWGDFIYFSFLLVIEENCGHSFWMQNTEKSTIYRVFTLLPSVVWFICYIYMCESISKGGRKDLYAFCHIDHHLTA